MKQVAYARKVTSDLRKQQQKGFFGRFISRRALYDEMYPWSLRKKQLRKKVAYFLFHLATTAYITMLVWTYWLAWDIECIRDLNVWLCVYLAIEFVHTVCSIVELVLWLYARDPPLGETKLRLILQYWVYIFTAVWILYGSTFMFSEEIIDCKEPVERIFKSSSVMNVKSLRLTASVLIVLGYFTVLWLVCYLLFGCVMYCLYKSWVKMDRETEKTIKSKDIDEMKKLRSERVKEKIRGYE